MADNTNISEAKLDVLEVSIDGDDISFESGVSFNLGYSVTPVRSSRVGQEILAHINEGNECSGTFNFLQVTQANYEILLELTSSAPREPLAAGAHMPTHLVKIKDPADSSDDYAIYLLAVVFTGISRSSDGAGPADVQVSWVAQRDSATGGFHRVGPAS